MKPSNLQLFIIVIISLLAIRCNKNTDTDFILMNRIDKIFNDYSKNHFIDESLLDKYTVNDINCASIDALLSKVYRNDQEVRTTGERDMRLVDSINLVTVNSIVKKCKNEVFSKNLSTKSYQAIFFTLQHSGDKDLMSYYYPILKKLINKEKISKTLLALYVDRFLGLENKKQIFGTQIKNNKLYKLEKPNEVNKRRKYIGLGNIEDYLKRFGLSFEEEVKNIHSN